jgi:nucleotidyltransferase substrate binding protein (TIGR01987 family)
MADIRWKQRFSNYESALRQLTSGVEAARSRELNDLEKQGLIQAFEFTHELAWNVLKDYFEYQGNSQITGSRDATREAFQMGLITDGQTWMEMIQSRNRTTHAYNRATAEEIVQKTINSYFPLFESLRVKLESLKATVE